MRTRLLPGSASQVNLGAVSFANGSIFGNADGQNAFYAIDFSVDSLSMREVRPVPEPGTLPLAAAGLLGGWLVTRRRRPDCRPTPKP
jgi:hypothetical protein